MGGDITGNTKKTTYLTQRHGEVVGDLAADADDDTPGHLPLVDVQNALERKLLEIQTVRLVVVRAHLLSEREQSTRRVGTSRAGEKNSTFIL